MASMAAIALALSMLSCFDSELRGSKWASGLRKTRRRAGEPCLRDGVNGWDLSAALSFLHFAITSRSTKGSFGDGPATPHIRERSLSTLALVVPVIRLAKVKEQIFLLSLQAFDMR